MGEGAGQLEMQAQGVLFEEARTIFKGSGREMFSMEMTQVNQRRSLGVDMRSGQVGRIICVNTEVPNDVCGLRRTE